MPIRLSGVLVGLLVVALAAYVTKCWFFANHLRPAPM
jgi:hypothetical protein